jgi:photosystem II stability/assembly factor-like uncharacterized protein
MGSNPVLLYRTTDAGLRWSPAGGAVPAGCDKASLGFATAQLGWLGNACVNAEPGLLLTTRDGGAQWAPQPLPASVRCVAGCEVYAAPQVFGQTAFLTVGAGDAEPYFLVSQDAGQAWTAQALPPGAGTYPRITFFGPADGILVPASSQGTIGRDFYTTADGGQTWTAVRPGRSFTALGTGFDFTGPRIGFAWVIGADTTAKTPPAIEETTDAGRSWTVIDPVLTAG